MKTLHMVYTVVCRIVYRKALYHLCNHFTWFSASSKNPRLTRVFWIGCFACEDTITDVCRFFVK